jgi:hypothetical protein
MTRSARRPFTLFALPALLLILAAVLANTGVRFAPDASAASSGSVTVNASVTSATSVTTCGASITVPAVLGSAGAGQHQDQGCLMSFGSSNSATSTLRAWGGAATFFSSTFTDAAGTTNATCAALSGTSDIAGLKVSTLTGGGATTTWCTGGVTAIGVNGGYRDFPASAANICAGATLGTSANSCTLGVGVWEYGGNATPASPTGTLNVDVI